VLRRLLRSVRRAGAPRLGARNARGQQGPEAGTSRGRTAGRRPSSHSLPAALDQVLARVREEFGESAGLITRSFTAGKDDRFQAALVYIDGLADRETINEHILKATMFEAELAANPPASAPLLDGIARRLVTASETQILYEWEALLEEVAAGNTALFIDGVPGALIVATPGWERRGVDEPVTEAVVRGPREGFTETLRTNETLLRRRIRSPRLRFRPIKAGTLTRTPISVAYIQGIADPKLVEEVCQRLERIEIDAVLESGFLEEFIQDKPWSIFPQTLRTERPDVVAANLLEGRVAVLTDNTPFALIVPVVFSQFLSSPEDYYERFPAGALIRMLRVFAFVLSLTLPAFYVAITTYHQELLPTDLILALAASRQGVPFPAVIEALLMEVLFEILREAGIRLPRVVGQAVSIVGALVVGEAAVSAGLVSPAMVIVVAMTAIASFATPVFSFAIAIRMLRFVFMLSAAAIGLFGIQLVGLLVLLRAITLESFGVPYLAPLAPLSTADLKDSVVRAPVWAMRRRPTFLNPQDTERAPAASPTNPALLLDEGKTAKDRRRKGERRR